MKVPRGFINRDHLAAYLGMIIPLTLGFLFIPPFANSQKPPARGESASGGNTENSLPAGRPGKPNNEPRTLLFFCVIVMGAALFFTMSRGGMFSFIVTLLFMMILVLRRRSIRRRGWILSVVVIFIILAIIWLGATPVIERILSIKGEITDHYFGGRLPVWQATLNIIKDYPIFGTGLGTFNYIFPKYQPAQIMSKHYTYAHSDFLELLSEAGIAGFILSLAFGLWLLADLFRRFNQRHDPWVVGLSIGFFGSLASIFFHSFTDFNLHIPANTLLLTLVLSLFIGTINCGHKREISSVIISKVGKVVLYPVTILSVGLFIFMSTKPAIADYYFRQATGDKIQAQIDLLKRASKFDSTNAKYDYYLGESYSKLGALSLQFAAYKKAVQLSLMSSKYHQSLAWTYGQLADLPRPYKRRSLINRKSLTLTFESNYMRKAFSEFEKAIALSPNNSYRHRAYAIWLFNHPTKKNIEKGVEVYRKAIEIEPKKTSEALSKYYKYQKDYKKLIDILPGTEESDCNALWFLIAKKGLKDAVDFAKEGLKTYSDNANLHFWIADRSFYDKDLPWEFTEEHYQIAFKNAPEDAYYRLWYGIHLHHRGEYEKALKSLETSVKLGLSSQNEEQAKKYIAECKEKSF